MKRLRPAVLIHRHTETEQRQTERRPCLSLLFTVETDRLTDRDRHTETDRLRQTELTGLDLESSPAPRSSPACPDHQLHACLAPDDVISGVALLALPTSRWRLQCPETVVQVSVILFHHIA